MQRIDPDRLGDVLEPGLAEIADRQIEPSLDLAIGVLRQADRARRANAFEPRGDVDAIAHEIAVGLLDDVAEMNADPELDALVRRDSPVALGHAVLNFDGAAHGVDHAAKLDKRAVPSSLDDAAVVRGDGGVDQVAAQPPEARKGAVLVGVGETAVTDNISGQDGSDLPGFGHSAPSCVT